MEEPFKVVSMSDVVVLDEVTSTELHDTQRLIDAAARVDGQSAVSEQGQLLLRGGAMERFGPRDEVRRWLAQRHRSALKAQGESSPVPRQEARA